MQDRPEQEGREKVNPLQDANMQAADGLNW